MLWGLMFSTYIHDTYKVSASISLFFVYYYFCFGVDARRGWSYSYGQAGSKTDLLIPLIKNKELQHLDRFKKNQSVSP